MGVTHGIILCRSESSSDFCGSAAKFRPFALQRANMGGHRNIADMVRAQHERGRRIQISGGLADVRETTAGSSFNFHNFTKHTEAPLFRCGLCDYVSMTSRSFL